MSFTVTQSIIDHAIVETLEFVIERCKRKRESVTGMPEFEQDLLGVLYQDDQSLRDQGFRGALAWVESECCEEIDRVREVAE